MGDVFSWDLRDVASFVVMLAVFPLFLVVFVTAVVFMYGVGATLWFIHWLLTRVIRYEPH